MSPQRIQRKRVKGWRMLAGAVYVGRGSEWGNPFRVGQKYMPSVLPHEVTARKRGCLTAFYVAGKPGIPLVRLANGPLKIEDVIAMYRGHAVEQIGPSKIRKALRGRDLACWCALDVPCHADVLLKIANAPQVSA